MTLAASASTHYLLDTNILLHYGREDALYHWIEARYGLRRVAPPPLVSIISIGEIRSLAAQLQWGAQKRQRLAEVLQGCIQVSLDLPGLVDAYAVIDAHNIAVGRKTGDNDAWLAATAHVTGARLLTTDHDFDHLDGYFIQRDWIDPASRLPGTP